MLLAVCGKPPAVTEDAKEPELSAVAVIGASTGLVVEESNVKATPAEPASAPEPAPVAERE